MNAMTRRKTKGLPKPDQKKPRVVQRTIRSWPEFVRIIQDWHGFRNWCFRGQASAEWSLRSSLSRHIEVSNKQRADANPLFGFEKAVEAHYLNAVRNQDC